MARICKACRQPVDDPRDHDCPVEDHEPGGDEPELGGEG